MADSEDAQSRSRRVANAVSDRAQAVLKEDYGKARGLALAAAKSRAYLYPIKGIFYFITHRILWQPFLSRIGPLLSLSASVFGGLFFFTYLPQMAVMVLVNGPLAPISTILLILSEGSAIINMAARGWLLQDALLDTFDGTLASRNSFGILKEGREIKSGSDPMKKLGKILKNPFQKFSPTAMIRYLMYLPLNFIPVVGTVMFVFLQGRNRGQSVHGRYFQLKKWSASQKKEWLAKHTGPYTAFGLVATVLEMVPIASMVFTYTNTVGAALWAADLENQNNSMTTETSPELRQVAEKSE